jgi:transcriptional regulator with XRE-family HTH domain
MENKVAELRKTRGFTQTELAQKAGISRPYLSAIEKGKQAVISNVIMLKIAKALNKPVTEIFFAAA